MKNTENLIVIGESCKEENWGKDYKGNEIKKGEKVVFDPANDVVVLETDLEDYLIEKLGFEFKTAE